MKKINFFRSKQILRMVIMVGILCTTFGFLTRVAGADEIIAVESNGATNSNEDTITKEVKSLTSGKILSASISYKMKNVIDNGQFVEVSARITNSGNKFKGKIQVIVPEISQNNTMYQKEITILAGETQTVSIEFPVYYGEPVLKVMIVSRKEKEIFATNVKIATDEFNQEASIHDSIRGQDFGAQPGKVPGVGKYALILLFYIILIGPVLYFILKKMDKRHLIWIVVPAFSICFSLIIYIAGSDTRVKNLFMGYYSYLTYDENKQATEEVYFTISSPQNQKHSVSIDNDYAIVAIQDSMFYSEQEKVKNDTYKTSVLYGDEKTKIVMKDYAGFAPVYFKATSETKNQGDYQSDLTYYNYQMTGSFVNQTGFDISNAFIVTSHSLVHIGNIDNESTSQVDDKEIVHLTYGDELYDSGFMSQLSNLDYNSALYLYIRNHFMQNNEASYLIGYINSEKNAFADKVGLNNNGEQVVIIPLEINDTVGSKVFIPSIEDYFLLQGDSDENGEKFTKVKYQFLKTDNVTALMYTDEMNQKKESMSGQSIYFDGTVKAYNNETKTYDILFTSGTDGVCTDLTKYLDEDNIIELLYEWNFDSKNQFNRKTPTIAVIKEVG